MVFASGFLGLAVFVVQQLGVVLAVGAATVLLAAYMLHLGKQKRQRMGHEHFLPATRWIERTGLVLIVVSGFGAVFLHATLGQQAVLETPAFIFKWTLIAAVLVFYIVERYITALPPYTAAAIRGVGGAQWYALLIVHGIAPAVGWVYLLSLYAAWVMVFMMVWMMCVYMLMPREVPLKSSSHKPSAAPAPQAPHPAPVLLPTVAHAELAEALPKTFKPAVPPLPPRVTVPLAPPKPKVELPALPKITMPTSPPTPPTPGLPPVWVMPRTPEETKPLPFARV